MVDIGVQSAAALAVAGTSPVRSACFGWSRARDALLRKTCAPDEDRSRRADPRRTRASPGLSGSLPSAMRDGRASLAQWHPLVMSDRAPPNLPMGPARSMNPSTTEARRCTRLAPERHRNRRRPVSGDRRGRLAGHASASALARQSGVGGLAQIGAQRLQRRLLACRSTGGAGRPGQSRCASTSGGGWWSPAL
jgi:hypothetical protein